MAEEIAFKNGRISNFEGLVTLTLDLVILHTAVHHSLTSPYMPNFTESKETFCGWTFEISFIRSTLSNSRPKKYAPTRITRMHSSTDAFISH